TMLLAISSYAAGALAAQTVSPFDQYRLAAAKGDAGALNALGNLFQTGNGVPLDFAKAYALFHLAASLPSRDPAQRVEGGQNGDALSAKMSDAQLQHAQDLFALCYGGDINLCGERIISSGGAVAAAPSTGGGLSVSVGGKTAVPLETAGGVYIVSAI